MTVRRTWFAAARLIMMIALILGLAATASAQKGKGKRGEEYEKQQRLNELLQQKQQIERQQAAGANRPQGQDLNRIIDRYENLRKSCEGKRADRCADVMYTLGSLYYDKAREESAATGSPPNYDKSLMMYWQLVREYPTFPKLPEVFYQISMNYISAGHLDTAGIILKQLVQRFPNSPRVSGAHFRLGELAFMDNNFNKAYEHFKKVKKDQVDIVTLEMTHYRMGECSYNVGDFDKAVEYFHGYVVECDANRYLKKEFRDMALEYIAIAFSEMPNGAQAAVKFFKKNKGKPYEADVIYKIGHKSLEFGKVSAMISAYETALKMFPNHKDAPAARKMLEEAKARMPAKP